jgi:hypothetical protein
MTWSYMQLVQCLSSGRIKVESLGSQPSVLEYFAVLLSLSGTVTRWQLIPSFDFLFLSLPELNIHCEIQISFYKLNGKVPRFYVTVKLGLKIIECGKRVSLTAIPKNIS